MYDYPYSTSLLDSILSVSIKKYETLRLALFVGNYDPSSTIYTINLLRKIILITYSENFIIEPIITNNTMWNTSYAKKPKGILC
jgi:hypothetical protein